MTGKFVKRSSFSAISNDNGAAALPCWQCLGLHLHLLSAGWSLVGQKTALAINCCCMVRDREKDRRSKWPIVECRHKQKLSCDWLAFRSRGAGFPWRVSYGNTYIKIGTIQRRLEWPLRKYHTQIREAFQIFANIKGQCSSSIGMLAMCGAAVTNALCWLKFGWAKSCFSHQVLLHHKR